MQITALIPAAGLGTRMIPATKELPKEMLPVPSRGKNGGLFFKPFIQLVYEQLYNAGVRTFIIVVGRGKRILQDHFVADWGFYELLVRKGKKQEAEELKSFLEKLEDSTIIWVDQPEPRGLGDAVLRGLKAITAEWTLIHLGDIKLHHPQANPVADMIRITSTRIDECSRGILHLLRVEDPWNYGVAVPETRIGEGEGSIGELVRIKTLLEKPKHPPSNLAISGIYILKTSEIRRALGAIRKNSSTGELELTDGIQLLAEGGGLCGAIGDGATLFIDIGRPRKYLEAVLTLKEHAIG